MIYIFIMFLKNSTTGCKGNKYHPFNSRRGRLKGLKVYTISSLNLIDFSKKGITVTFCSRRTAYIDRDIAKTYRLHQYVYLSWTLYYLKNIRVRCSLRKIK